jgi:hypothetical protein
MPLETISGVGRTPRREAGVIEAASFGIASRRARSAALECAGKIKGRLKAADENTGDADIRPQNFREQEGREWPGRGAYIRFLFAYKILAFKLGVVKSAGQINQDLR